jgi:UDPglucose 6-dehydrogenase
VSIVEKVVNDLETPIIVMKSTVEPGTTDRLIAETGKHIVFSPEFAGESVYWSPYKFDRDMKELPYYIFGGDNQDCKIVHDLYIQIGGPTKKYFITDAKTAEMVKYVTNCFYAAKITFCNEVKEICDRTGVEWDTVRQLWLNDPRINPMHTAVFEENRGFGGKCFPKDTAALVRFAEKEGYDAEVLRAVRSANKKFREMNKK